jgi:cytochrome c biogenesis protein CcmG, thiol:disulfide interchange protein DsbE
MSAESAEKPPETAPETPKEEISEAEDKAALVGVMYSERPWIVPGWMKGAFFWIAIIAIAGLGYYELDKRLTFNKLIIDSVVEPEPWANKPTPPVNLPEGDTGKMVDLSAFKGSWVVLNFWATWCPPCRDEMPSMEMLNRRFQRDGKNIKMVAVSVDEDYKEVHRFFGETKPTFTVLWDREKTVSGAFGSRKFPETYLINPEGKVVAKYIGPRDWYNQATVQYFEQVIAGRRKPA